VCISDKGSGNPLSLNDQPVEGYDEPGHETSRSTKFDKFLETQSDRQLRNAENGFRLNPAVSLRQVRLLLRYLTVMVT
jgi:hypothetical protein